jgi:hypothetical protein
VDLDADALTTPRDAIAAIAAMVVPHVMP